MQIPISMVPRLSLFYFELRTTQHTFQTFAVFLFFVTFMRACVNCTYLFFDSGRCVAATTTSFVHVYVSFDVFYYNFIGYSLVIFDV